MFLGRETLLACRHRRGYDWEMEAPTLSGLCALLSVAYGKCITYDDPLARRVDQAIHLLGRDPRAAGACLASLPPPVADDERIALGARLLRQGTTPTMLEAALRRAPLGLPPAPRFTRHLCLCADGVVLGHGTVIADLLDRPGGRTGLAIAGHEERILALLSLGRGPGRRPPCCVRSPAPRASWSGGGRTSPP